MKSKTLLITLALATALSVGCAKQPAPAPAPAPATEPVVEAAPAETTPDVVTTASLVNDEAAFENAISKDGTWIIATLKDLSFDKDLVLDGEFKNGKKDEAGNDVIQRKIALYAQDDKRNVTARYTLTAPTLTINSPNARIQGGIFKGDVYVNTNDFQLVDATVEGNIYFASEEAKAGFKIDDKSKVTGVMEVK